MGLLHKLKRKIKKPIIKIISVKRKQAISKAIKKREKYTPFITAEDQAYKKCGRSFLKNFKPIIFNGRNKRKYQILSAGRCSESANTISIKLIMPETYHKNDIAHIGIGFEKNALIIEVMQTENPQHSKKYLNEFRRTTKTQPLNWLLKQAETRAKQFGFKEVKIRAPETMKWYNDPWTWTNKTLNTEEIRTNMRVLYNKIAKSEGYKRKGIFYIKQL
jgi:hypothetical protein